ncbi:phosphoribosylamine--glycine ligase [Rhodovibrio salinarum]|uniref:Phosphoribosylamine--glycine ligase n=1 Tax=Rhodovibrio salinarum TaxID=1087 RepID=A0A934V1Q1_9PROT|nr:phosphoribosylamine--glycine ligase [Rhodovibrio salinarum]MBK1698666.1 phosphoribosylamine--glycine ligase [Rhodovibrio salinarum]
MKILVVGGGGREHALCWALAASPLCDELYCAPGNAGIAEEATCLEIAADDVDALVKAASDKAVDLVVVGPEAPLVAGLVDALEAAGIRAFGPSKAAAELEGSKAFAKYLCDQHGIPTAAFQRFTDPAEAKAYVASQPLPIVVKADGLAAGKGVTVCQSHAEAERAIEEALVDKRFGAAGDSVIVEECLTGQEVSAFALVDGDTALMLPCAQDHKAAYDGDTGPNTGGMGAYSPTPLVDEATAEVIQSTILQPTVDAMKAEGRPFKGLLYAGLMMTPDGPKVLEYNVRFGDPECQVLMMRLMSDLLPALLAACDGVLDSFDMRWFAETAVSVVLAARGYPGSYEKGEAIGGLEALKELDDVIAFHAGTKADGDGTVRSNGGRVLTMTALGGSIEEARQRAYTAIDQIDWPGGFCRRDIGWHALGKLTIETED